jgi:hypothetical protein
MEKARGRTEVSSPIFFPEPFLPCLSTLAGICNSLHRNLTRISDAIQTTRAEIKMPAKMVVETMGEKRDRGPVGQINLR